MPSEAGMIAVDIGNTRAKFGRYTAAHVAAALPCPEQVAQVADADVYEMDLSLLLEAPPKEYSWRIGSVNRSASARLLEWLVAQQVPAQSISILGCSDLPIRVTLPAPETIGIDRLLAAVAANHLRDSNQPAIVIDTGTATTCDVINAEGEYFGGVIMPGVRMQARALHEFTDVLPLVSDEVLAAGPPKPIGTDTISAMHSGIVWGAVGALREIEHRMHQSLGVKPLVLLTGGAAPIFVDVLKDDPFFENLRHEPHLVLAGIVLAQRTKR